MKYTLNIRISAVSAFFSRKRNTLSAHSLHTFVVDALATAGSLNLLYALMNIPYFIASTPALSNAAILS
jgi:hypothetical protein